jgi:4-hydroxyproline epimerase
VRVIDSHTEGEPTRVVIEGGPDLGSGSLQERLRRFANEHDEFRRTITLEPRGSDAMVGALLCPPTREDCASGVIFFNNTGYLGMCGHGTIGVAVTLAYLDRIQEGKVKLETPVGVVSVELNGPNEATITNVPSYRYLTDVGLEVSGLGEVRGDVAWGGNWFFLTNNAPAPLTLEHETELAAAAAQVRAALEANGITGAGGEHIDHIEFFAAGHSTDADSRNYVYCPGGAYDRSPCGTGTSAKLACLAEDGSLEAGEPWVQESVIGSRFVASYQRNDAGEIIPRITGRAYICSEAKLVRQADDPFGGGIVPS